MQGASIDDNAGWTALAQAYDDGGVSGATVDRPALQQLLADIQAGKIDAAARHDRSRTAGRRHQSAVP
jgi:DNA invertase Pin-like site-specific DNA recombinase